MEQKVESPLILGFSHVWGETHRLDESTSFWKNNGFRTKLTWDLPVFDEKRSKLLNAAGANAVHLEYLEPKEEGIPIEFIQHRPQAPVTTPISKPSITLLVKKNEIKQLTGPDGNTIFFHPGLNFPRTLVIRTPSPDKALQLFLSLGFSPASFEHLEYGLCEDLFSKPYGCCQISPPLFPQLGIRIVLVLDLTRNDRPRVDGVGWTGIGFLVRNLENLSNEIVLLGRQEIQVDGQTKRTVTFYNGDGLILEFLKIGG